jgi:hypothetical protein
MVYLNPWWQSVYWSYFHKQILKIFLDSDRLKRSYWRKRKIGQLYPFTPLLKDRKRSKAIPYLICITVPTLEFHLSENSTKINIRP